MSGPERDCLHHQALAVCSNDKKKKKTLYFPWHEPFVIMQIMAFLLRSKGRSIVVL